MTTFAELPEADRKLIRSGRAQPAKARAPRTPPRAADGRSDWTCHPCGQRFDQFAPAQRHMDTAHGGGRLVLDLHIQGETE